MRRIGRIVLMGGAIVALQALGLHQGGWEFGLALLVLNLICIVVLFVFVDRGRLVSPAYSPIHERDLRKLRAYAMRAPLGAEGD